MQTILKAFLYFALASLVSAAFFDRDGNVIPDASEDNVNVYWPAATSNETFYNGICNYYGFPCYLLKTWKTEGAPPADLPAYVFLSVSAFSDANNPTWVRRFMNNATLNSPDNGAEFDLFSDVAATDRRKASINVNLFTTGNATALGVGILYETAREMYLRGFTFYEFADRMPNPGETILSIAINGPDAPSGTVVRKSFGQYTGLVESIRSDTTFLKAYDTTFRHKANYFMDGTPVFNSDKKLIGSNFVVDAEWNYGIGITELKQCFGEDGVWNFGLSGCLISMKRRVALLSNGYQLWGYEPPCSNGRCLEVKDSKTVPNTFTLAALFTANGISAVEEQESVMVRESLVGRLANYFF